MDNQQPTNKSIFQLVRSIILGIGIPIIAMWLWYSASQNTNPLSELQLIRKGITAKGIIIKTQENENVADMYDGRKSGITFDYDYEYSFRIANGNIINSYGNEKGQLPEKLINSNLPYSVNVEYLENNPEISRIQELTNNKTVYQWFSDRILLGVLILIIASYFGLVFIKSEIRGYNIDLLKRNS